METISFGDQSFQVGAVGKLKLKGGPAVDLRVTEFTFEKSYTSEFDLWGSHFIFAHYLETVTISGLPQVRASVNVEASGFSSPILGQLFTYGLNKEMLGWLENFRDLLEAEQKADEKAV